MSLYDMILTNLAYLSHYICLGCALAACVSILLGEDPGFSYPQLILSLYNSNTEVFCDFQKQFDTS